MATDAEASQPRYSPQRASGLCGTADFAVPSLRACNARHQVVAAVTQPARPGSRGRPAPRPVADTAAQLGIPVFQPERIRAEEVVQEVLGLGADVLVVAATARSCPGRCSTDTALAGSTSMPRCCPAGAGRPDSPAIFAGDPVTGVCVMKMEVGLDTGPVYARREVAIDAEATAAGLTQTLAIAGAEELVAVLAALERGAAAATPQPEEGVTHAARLTREDGVLDWEARSAEEVDRMVRALDPWPGVTADLAGATVRILSGRPIGGRQRDVPGAEGSSSSATIVPSGSVVRIEGESALVAAATGLYRIDTVQSPGRRAMSAAAFLRGRR